MSIKFNKKKTPLEAKLLGIELPNNFPNSKIKFKKKNSKDNSINLFDKLTHYKICVPLRIDQRHFLENERDVRIIFETVNRTEDGHLNDKFSSKQINKIKKLNIEDIQDNKAKKILRKIKKDLTEISAASYSKSQKDNATYKYFYKKYIDEDLQMKYLTNVVNGKFIKNKQRIPLDDIIRYDKIGESKGKLGKSDIELFGAKEIYTLHALKRGSSSEQEEIDIPKKIPGLYEKIDNSENVSFGPAISENMINMYKVGLDPADVFEGEETHVSLPAKISGNVIGFTNKNKHAKTTSTDIESSRQSQILNDVILKNNPYQRTNQNTVNTFDYANTTRNSKSADSEVDITKKLQRQIGVKVSKASKRYKVYNLELNLTSQDLNPNGNVVCYLKKYDAKGLEISSKRFIINVKYHFQKFIMSQFNTDLIDVNIVNDVQDRMRVNINNYNDMDVIFDLYKVDLNSDPLSVKEHYVRQQLIKTFSMSRNSTNSFVFENLENGSSVLRVKYKLSILGDDVNIDNFSSYPILSSNIAPVNPNYKCYTVARCESGASNDIKNTPGVIVSLLCDDPSFHKVKYFKRDITLSLNSAFEEIMNESNDDKLGYVDAREIKDTSRLIDDHIYEYMCQIMTKYGYTYYTAPFRVKHVLPDNFARAQVESLTDSSSFAIKLNKIDERKNIVSELFDIVKEAGNEDLFTDDIKTINQASQELLNAEISQLKFSEGSWEFENIGTFKSGETFKIPNIENIELLSEDQSKFLKLVKVQIYQNSPIQIVERIQELINSVDKSLTNRNPTAIEQSVALQKAKKELSELRESQQKLLTREFLSKGMLPADKKSVDLFNDLEAIKTSLPVNDVYYFFLDNLGQDNATESSLKPLQNFNLKIDKTTYYKFDDGRINLSCNFNITQAKTKYVDFYIVLCKKNGDIFPVTTLLGDSRRKVSFIDDTNKNFMGELVYYVQPVFINGTLGTKYKLRKINYYNNYS